ncbi:hypothetical protein, partial [Slackia isoflavoniconvertens]|uniref:hypothetical protein n=1 Tax=Slackia isoflavoniconvertens TaxID=572010 RepID=UPI003AB481B9
FLGTFYAWSLKIIPMADDHVFSFLDVFSFQFAKEILRYLFFRCIETLTRTHSGASSHILSMHMLPAQQYTGLVHKKVAFHVAPFR